MSMVADHYEQLPTDAMLNGKGRHGIRRLLQLLYKYVAHDLVERAERAEGCFNHRHQLVLIIGVEATRVSRVEVPKSLREVVRITEESDD